MAKKWTIESVQNEFSNRGIRLLDIEFKGVDVAMNCIALCGHEKKLSLSNLLINHGLYCRKCSYTVGASKRKFDYEYVKSFFEKEGCQLISEKYVNWRGNLRYIAQCGHEHVLPFHKFKNDGQGRLCRACGRPKGELHFNYNPKLTDEERISNRDYYAIDKWRLDVFKRDDFTCQVCGDNNGGNLVAHHLNGYNWDTDNRLNIENGITLCNTCHLNFHHNYGYGNNTIEQFQKWHRRIPR